MKRKWLAVGIVLLFVGTCVIPAIAQNIGKTLPASRGTWLYVGGSGPGNYSKIQDAIDNATNGDTVFVYGGVYQQIVMVDKAVTLRGENKETTCLDGTNNHGWLVIINSSSVTIQGFSLENCSNPGGYTFPQAICVLSHVPQFKNIYITDCIITHNDKGIFFENVTNILITNCTIHHNRAQSIWGINSTRITIRDCIMNNNGETQGVWTTFGGILLNALYNENPVCTHVDISGCDIYANKGEGISIDSAEDVIIHNNSIRSSTWSGIGFSGITHLRILDNTISGNTKQGIAGDKSFAHELSDVVIQRNNISRNGNGQELSDGGIYLSECPDILIVDNLFYKNNKFGIFPSASPHTHIIHNSFIDNEQGIYGQSSQCTISNNSFNNNQDAGIHLQTASEETIINNNTIRGSTNGIYIGQASEGAQIFHNTITDGSVGISIFFSREHNISSNTIENMTERGLFLNYSERNIIYRNNLIDCALNPYIYNFAGSKNRWVGNYWNRPRLLPKLLVGMQERILHMNNTHLKLPLFEIDWHPALEPYDI
jgi:parallel beta-helix repeat protein